jgi:6-phosphofructokinase
MGHTSGWLALGAGIAGGADVILIPEIPYDLEIVASFIKERRRSGKRFSILAVAEGAMTRDEAKLNSKNGEKKDDKDREKEKKKTKTITGRIELPDFKEPMASRLARELQHLTGIEARMTSLGHVQRGGIPSSADRLLCTRLAGRIQRDGRGEERGVCAGAA